MLTLLTTQNIPKGIITKTKNINTVNSEWNSGGIKLIKKRMVEEGMDCFNRKDSYARKDKICLLFENINDNAIEYNTLKIVNFKIVTYTNIWIIEEFNKVKYIF